MWIRNTSRYPTNEVRELLRFAAQLSDVHDVQVNVKNCSGAYAGRAYPGIPAIARAHARANFLVTVRIGAPERFPKTNLVTEHRWKKTTEGTTPDPTCRTRIRNGVQEHEITTTHPYGGQASPFLEYQDWREALIAVAAHEFRATSTSFAIDTHAARSPANARRQQYSDGGAPRKQPIITATPPQLEPHSATAGAQHGHFTDKAILPPPIRHARSCA